MPATQGFDPASVPLVVERVVIVAARAGEVTAIDLDRRRRRWIVRTADPILAAHPVLVGTAVMLATRKGRVVAFRLANGAPVRLPPAPGRAIATAADSEPAGVQSAGVEVVGRDAGAGRIERWQLGSGP